MSNDHLIGPQYVTDINKYFLTGRLGRNFSQLRKKQDQEDNRVVESLMDVLLRNWVYFEHSHENNPSVSKSYKGILNAIYILASFLILDEQQGL
jgi:hypothetical protein